jgi:nucleoside-diphosphate-sugar epimerase
MTIHDHRILITGYNSQDAHVFRDLYPPHVLAFTSRGTSRPPGNHLVFPLSPFSHSLEHELRNILVSYQPTSIIHLASSNGSSESATPMLSELYTSNVFFTERLLSSVLNHSPSTHVTLCGSVHQYTPDPCRVLQVDISHAESPLNSYGLTKSINRLQAKLYASYGLKVAFAILFNHESVHRTGDFLIPKLVRFAHAIRSLSLRNPLPNLIIRNPNTFLDLSCAYDVCRALYHVSSNQLQGEFILGTGTLISLTDIIAILSDHALVDLGKHILYEEPLTSNEPHGLVALPSEVATSFCKPPQVVLRLFDDFIC